MIFKSPETKRVEGTIQNFVSKLFEARIQAHVFHLQTKSFAKHMALGEFYDTITDLTDSIVEQHQGDGNIIKGYRAGIIIEGEEKVITYFEELKRYVSNKRYIAVSKDDTHIQNTIDEIVSLIDSTLYKLKTLA